MPIYASGSSIVPVIELSGGLLVQEAALVLAVRLEAAGHALSVKDGTLLVSRGSALSDEDRAAIRALKNHLLAVVGYEAPKET